MSEKASGFCTPLSKSVSIPTPSQGIYSNYEPLLVSFIRSGRRFGGSSAHCGRQAYRTPTCRHHYFGLHRLLQRLVSLENVSTDDDLPKPTVRDRASLAFLSRDVIRI